MFKKISKIFIAVMCFTNCLAFSVHSAEFVNIRGDVTAQDGTPLCAMILANGQYMFSCNPTGEYDLAVPPDESGQITLFAFCDGQLPYKTLLSARESNYNIEMQSVPESVWEKSGNNIYYDNGNVGIGVNYASSTLEVNGPTKIFSGEGENIFTLANKHNGGMWQFRLQGDGASSNNFHLSNTNLNLTAMTIRSVGHVGFGIDPIHPLEMKSHAHVTTGGVWTNASSRDYKENIRDLTEQEAETALEDLKPVKFNYKIDKEDEYVGFISEDVPDLVANKDRKGLSSMDIVAVLTKMIQVQQKKIKELESQFANLQEK